MVEAFRNKPQGRTPLPRVLNQVLDDISPSIQLTEQKLLIIIATDGEPTDDQGRTAITQFKKALQRRTNKMYTTILVCTDDDESVDYLNRWDNELPRLDVVDDFRSEKRQILNAQGQSFRFSFGDYVVKCLVGSVDPELDKLDEVDPFKMFKQIENYFTRISLTELGLIIFVLFIFFSFILSILT